MLAFRHGIKVNNNGKKLTAKLENSPAARTSAKHSLKKFTAFTTTKNC